MIVAVIRVSYRRSCAPHQPQAAFCVETLEDALARHGKPEIFNTDQGSQFTGSAFTGVCGQSSQRATWPPSAAVRQRSMADITFKSQF
jgi:putative transposase